MDRLDKDEIIEIIRLIRNTANFRNTFFIVAYDRNYVVNAIKQHNLHNHEEFLEKIFQIEVNLPYFKKDVLRYELAKKLKESLPENMHSTIKTDVIGTPSSVPEFLNDWLESMRDVTRLANTLLLNHSKLNGEVVFNDFMRIELLRLKYPSAYELLYRKTSDFLEIQSHPTEKNSFQLKKNSDDNKIETEFELYLSKNHDQLSIPENDISKITEFVNRLFGVGFSFDLTPRSPLSIVYPSKFKRYFAYALLQGDLSAVKFSKERALSQEKFNQKITKWVKGGLELELRNQFSEIKSFDDRDDFEKVLRAIFHLANQPTQKNIFSRNIVGYDGNDLMNKLSNYDKRLTKFYDEKNELNQFVISLFTQARSPYVFESDLIRYLNGHCSFEMYSISKEDLEQIMTNYIRQYCEKAEKFEPTFWDLFHNCKQIRTNPSGENKMVVPEEAKKIMKDFVLNKGMEGFLFAVIDIKLLSEKKFTLSNIVIDLFDNWKTFEEALDKKGEDTNSPFFDEFKEFLAAFAKNKYSGYVDFTFKEIPVERKIIKK